MRKYLFLIAIVIYLFTGCSSNISGQSISENNEQINASADDKSVNQAQADNIQQIEFDNNQKVPEDVLSTINDWILGSDYGISKINFDGISFDVYFEEDTYSSLRDFEKDDINEALINLGNAYGYENCRVNFSDGASIIKIQETNDQTITTSENTKIDNAQIHSDSETINLIFIHHSVGENWLNDGLNAMLNENNIHVADTYYGWRNMGDYTDTADWPSWFNDDVMPIVYNKKNTETANNSISPANGENTIIMFKSCFPNSDVGNSIDDEIDIYNNLLDYFSNHTDKMFVLVTSPPMQQISHPEKTRELTNFLVYDWLKDYKENNVYVYDLYNILTSEDNHHMLVEDSPRHIVDSKNNTLYYDSGGDDHPNIIGNTKATQEFVPLLLYWINLFEND